MTQSNFEQVGQATDLRSECPTAVRVGGRSIGLFHDEGAFFATDNRCPHMGFPLTDGSVSDGILTCPWHHARFELGCGDTLDPFADDVQTYPVRIENGAVYVRPEPVGTSEPERRWSERLEHGLEESLDLIVAKAVLGLADCDVDRAVPLRIGAEFGTQYRAAGWGRGLTTLAAMANLSEHLAPSDRPRAMYTGLRTVASDCAGEPPYFPQDPLTNDSLSHTRLQSWFRDTIAVRDADGAERIIRGAIDSEPDPGILAKFFIEAATAHRYLDGGHRLDFTNKAFELLDAIGWSYAGGILPSLVPGLATANRAEESAAWRRPIDLITMIEGAIDRLPRRIDAGRDHAWNEPSDLQSVLLGDDPAAIVDRLETAISNGATPQDLSSTVATASATRIVQFGTANEFRDWNAVHHTYSYANAVRALADRTSTSALYRAIFDGAMRVYLDRFLNVPPTPIPDPSAEMAEADLLAEIDGLFDVESDDSIDRAGQLVARHLHGGGDSEPLIQLLGGRLLREDIGFHPRQNFEAAVSMYRHGSREPDRHLHLIATARYLVAHAPTRRSGEQTFHIAERLHRGERIHRSGTE